MFGSSFHGTFNLLLQRWHQVTPGSPFQTKILLKYCQSCLIRFHQTCFLLFCQLLSRAFFIFFASLDFALITSVKASNKQYHGAKKRKIMPKKNLFMPQDRWRYFQFRPSDTPHPRSADRISLLRNNLCVTPSRFIKHPRHLRGEWRNTTPTCWLRNEWHIEPPPTPFFMLF